MLSLAALLLAVSLPPETMAYAEAGYDFGADLPKSPTATCSVADFGAKPNDKLDDTISFQFG